MIAEKPSVAKDIARIIGATQRNDGYLSGNGYMVTWAFGHLIQLVLFSPCFVLKTALLCTSLSRIFSESSPKMC